MKNYLAIDTASKYLCAVLCYRGEVYTFYEEDCAMKHSTLLMPAVDSLFEQSGASLQDLDFFACNIGAGSFTGIRIGIATAKGFALATGKPILPFTSFSLAAYNGEGKKILALCDALHGHYYSCAFDEEGKEVCSPAYIEEAEVKRFVQEGYALRTAENLGTLPFAECERVCPAKALQGVVEAAYEHAENFKDPIALYVRKSQAENERKKKAAGK